jgi:redox-sensitive bicupin YhaK (pirin superfamily)
MLALRRDGERGRADYGWLDTRYTFSFADYHDPAHRGWRVLRVINEDRVAPGGGFPTHPHRDMEILTYILEGALEHKDSMGTGSVIRPGEVQRMSAGTGVTHSEVNASRTEPVHLLQIWILPESSGITPGYEQKLFREEERRGKLRLVASRDGAEGSVTIHQDARLYAGLLAAGEEVEHAFDPERYGWLQVARGRVRAGGAGGSGDAERADRVAGAELGAGDGAAIAGERRFPIRALEPAEILLFDLP